MVRIADFLAIGRRGLGSGVRMRMIETDHIQPLSARVTPPVDVLFGIDEKSRGRAIRDIPCCDCVHNSRTGSNQKSAAFRRRRLTRVRHNPFKYAAPDMYGPQALYF